VATHVQRLTDEDARISELAAMLGAPGAAGLASAREILAAARTRKGI
jgi:DNA repair ATPase RecN